MSEIEGKVRVCDVCGDEVFLKYLGTDEYDGGFTKVRKHETADGWHNIRAFGVNGDVCPSCYNYLSDVVAEAVRDLKGESER